MSNSSVIPIRANIRPDTSAEPNADVVKKLAELLEMAQAGEIRGFAYASLHPGDLTTYSTSGRTTRGVLGALTLLQHDMCKTDLEND